jgi:hypothetical protein
MVLMIALATDRKGGQPITLATDHTRAIFVAGKRGSGKSYTLGRIIEEYHRLGTHLIVVIDPLAVFWTTAIPAQPHGESDQHDSQGAATGGVLAPAGTPKRQAPLVAVRVIVPGDPTQVLGPLAQAMTDRGVDIARLWLNPSDLTADAWLALFGLTLSSPQGIALSRAVRTAKHSTCHFQLSNLIAAVEGDEQIADAGRLASTYAADLPAWLKGIRQPGDAIIVDDATERVAIGRILPRRTLHGGGTVGAIHESPTGARP